MRKLICLVTGIIISTSLLTFAGSGAPRLEWFGQACFLITSPQGKRLLIDPFGVKLPFPQPNVEADVVLVTHEHFDHNNVEAARGKPVVIHGLKDEGKKYNDVDRTVAGFEIKSVRTYHDDKGGAKRGKNTVFVITTGGIRLAHLGDLGHMLTEEQVRAIGKVDVLMIPVGGYYTIDAATAWKVIGQLEPRVIVPMHYKTGRLVLPISTVSEFLTGHESMVKNIEPKSVPLTLPSKQEIWVFPTP